VSGSAPGSALGSVSASMPIPLSNNIQTNLVPPSNPKNSQNPDLKTLFGSCQFFNDKCPENYQPLGNFSINGNVYIIPIANICFPAGTPIETNNGKIPIEKINPQIHTIRNKPIVGITKTIYATDKYLVCFEKDSLGNNIPSQKTIISKNHKIFYNGKMIRANEFIGLNDKITKIRYKGEILYNVLMEEYDKIIVNNLICETLYPENGIAKLYKICQKLNIKDQEKCIQYYNHKYKKKYNITKK
jgi:hypothetical protein